MESSWHTSDQTKGKEHSPLLLPGSKKMHTSTYAQRNLTKKHQESCFQEHYPTRTGVITFYIST